MITSQASLDDLNSKLDQNVSSINFRPCIVVDDCAAWDEDKWLDLRIGDVEMQCFKPCTRCILTTVNPETGTKDKDMQPLKKLREFRLGPGKLRQEFGESPIFGVNAGLVKTGYIHVGQTVWAKYKPSAFWDNYLTCFIVYYLLYLLEFLLYVNWKSSRMNVYLWKNCSTQLIDFTSAPKLQ